MRYQVDRREESAFLSSSSGGTLPTRDTHSSTGNMKDTAEKEAARLIQRLRDLQEWQSETERKILVEQERERSRSMRKTVALLDNNDTEDDTVSSMEYDNDHHEIVPSVPPKLVNITLFGDSNSSKNHSYPHLEDFHSRRQEIERRTSNSGLLRIHTAESLNMLSEMFYLFRKSSPSLRTN